MSFVLDALKISEQRRSKFARAAHAYPPRPYRARRRRLWFGGLGVVVAAGLVILSWRLLIGTSSAPAGPADTVGGTATGTAVESGFPPPSGTPPRSASGTAAGTALESGFPQPSGPTLRSVSGTAAGTALESAPAAQSAAESAADRRSAREDEGAGQAIAGAGGRSADSMEGAATGPASSAATKMPASETQPEPSMETLAAPPADWPPLELQMHFYNPEPGGSFVQINGRSYREGERLKAGPQVEEITRDGVTLAHRGQRALLGMD